MAIPINNDQNSNAPQDVMGGEPQLNLYDLALKQEREEKARNKRVPWKNALTFLLCGGAVVAVLIMAAIETLDAVFFPSQDWKKHSLLEWPGGIQLQVEEQFISNYDYKGYTYSFLQSGEQIALPLESQEHLTIIRGSSQSTPYFFMQELIGICRHTRTGSMTWETWSPGDESLKLWMNQFKEARGKVRKKRNKKEFFTDADYKIINFKVDGRTWAIRLQDVYAPNNTINPYYGGMPPSLHVLSHDFGATWKVKEPVVVPSWLDEIHKK